MRPPILGSEFHFILFWLFFIIFPLLVMIKLENQGKVSSIIQFIIIFFISFILSQQYLGYCINGNFPVYPAINQNVLIWSPLIVGFIVRAIVLKTYTFRSNLSGIKSLFDYKTFLSVIGAYFGLTLFISIYFIIHPFQFFCR